MVTYTIGPNGWIAIGDDTAEVIVTSTGDDWVEANGGNDEITTSDGSDVIYAGLGDDLINAGAGNDTLIGGDGADRLYDYGGNDYIDGGSGDDFISVGAGNDLVDGGAGNDILRSDAFFGYDSLYGGEGNDWLYASQSPRDPLDPAAIQTLNGGAGDDVMFGSPTSDCFMFDTEGNNVFTGGRAADTIMAGAGNDWIDDRASPDMSIPSAPPRGYYVAGAGNDIIYGSAVSDTIFDGSGDDFVSSGGGGNTFYMGSGVDVIELDPAVLGNDSGITQAANEILHYGTSDAVAAGNLDIISNFVTDRGSFEGAPTGDYVRYDSALGTDVYWYDDGAGNVMMANGQGIFAKFIGITAAGMNDAFMYV